MKISVVLPVLDEGARIEAQLRHLLALRGFDELLVVDGGSTDDTLERVRRFTQVRLLDSARGRSRQMNTGARVARGDAVLFVHADVTLPVDAATEVARILSLPGVVGGAFRTWTRSEGRRPWVGPWLHLADMRSRYSDLPYGDQAIFVRASAFEVVGGFPEQPLMEDLEFSRRLRRLGRIVTSPRRVSVSGRRFEERPIFYLALMNTYPLLYRAGVSPETLARHYRNVR